MSKLTIDGINGYDQPHIELNNDDSSITLAPDLTLHVGKVKEINPNLFMEFARGQPVNFTNDNSINRIFPIANTKVAKIKGVNNILAINNGILNVTNNYLHLDSITASEGGKVILYNSYIGNQKSIINVKVNSKVVLKGRTLPISKIKLAPTATFSVEYNDNKYEIKLTDKVSKPIEFASVDNVTNLVDKLESSSWEFFSTIIKSTVCKDFNALYELPHLVKNHIGSYLIGEYIDYSKTLLNEL